LFEPTGEEIPLQKWVLPIPETTEGAELVFKEALPTSPAAKSLTTSEMFFAMLRYPTIMKWTPSAVKTLWKLVFLSLIVQSGLKDPARQESQIQNFADSLPTSFFFKTSRKCMVLPKSVLA